MHNFLLDSGDDDSNASGESFNMTMYTKRNLMISWSKNKHLWRLWVWRISQLYMRKYKENTYAMRHNVITSSSLQEKTTTSQTMNQQKRIIIIKLPTLTTMTKTVLNWRELMCPTRQITSQVIWGQNWMANIGLGLDFLMGQVICTGLWI